LHPPSCKDTTMTSQVNACWLDLLTQKFCTVIPILPLEVMCELQHCSKTLLLLFKSRLLILTSKILQIQFYLC
jgi:hypothetical protein